MANFSKVVISAVMLAAVAVTSTLPMTAFAQAAGPVPAAQTGTPGACLATAGSGPDLGLFAPN